MSIKPKGGRGHTAPYETTHLRVPVPIKDQLQSFIDSYREQVISGQIDPSQQFILSTESSDNKMPSKDKAVEIAKEVLKGKKSARQSLGKLLTSLYGEDINL